MNKVNRTDVLPGTRQEGPFLTTEKPSQQDAAVSILSITQATTATFTDLFIQRTFLCFIRSGTKRVICPVNGEILGGEGDLLVFSPGSMVTLENRPVPNARYHAEGVFYTNDMIEAVFSDQPKHAKPPGIQIVRAAPSGPSEILRLIQDTLSNEALPPSIRQHRLLEPLIWLRHQGVRLPTENEEQPLGKLRHLIETDLSHPWRVGEVARHFAMSEATLRRWLARSGYGFSEILRNARLEKGLALLQTTEIPVSQIALECGFKTPSHFSDSFKRRFGIKPKEIRTVSV